MNGAAGISGIDHMNLLTTPERLAVIGRFYADVLGLRIGPDGTRLELNFAASEAGGPAPAHS
jgi:hypothetical protein